jgi:tetratricopeptide (TPR) repeat protein
MTNGSPDIASNGSRSSVVNLKSWLRDRASKAESQKDFESAVKAWRQILRVSGRENEAAAEAHYHLGLVNERLKEMTKSVFHLGCAVRLQPESARYHLAFGRVFLELRHFRLAKTHFEKALRLEPQNENHWRHYAWALFQSGELDRAIEIAHKALELNPHSERCLWLNIHLLTERRRWKEAAQKLQQWKKSRPHSKNLKICLQWSQRRYALSMQGAVHQWMRKNTLCDGHPFYLNHIRAAQKIWLDFCVEHPEFSEKRANLRLVRIWAGASLIVALSDSRSIPFEQFAKRFEVKSYELEAAVRMLQAPNLGRRLAAYEN